MWLKADLCGVKVSLKKALSVVLMAKRVYNAIYINGNAPFRFGALAGSYNGKRPEARQSQQDIGGPPQR
jgi:hypothetical protein